MREILFKKADYNVNALISDISIGKIRLPEIQRPFVWQFTKVKDLFIIGDIEHHKTIKRGCPRLAQPHIF
jgi:uncharacterized protein with ParB-like and HNH nuclease domain